MPRPFLDQPKSAVRQELQLHGHKPLSAASFTAAFTPNEFLLYGQHACSGADPSFVLALGPHAAKDLLLILSEQVSAYEVQFGTLRTQFMIERSARAGSQTLDG